MFILYNINIKEILKLIIYSSGDHSTQFNMWNIYLRDFSTWITRKKLRSAFWS